MFFSPDAHRASKYAILVHFCNNLTVSRLPHKGIIQHTSTHNKHYKDAFSHCETCPAAVRKTPNGVSVRHVLRLERGLTASGSLI